MSRTVTQTYRRHTCPLLSLAFMAVFCSTGLSATEADDPAWRSFQHARGEPALIGANADHPRADTAFRPIPVVSADDIDADRFRLGFHLFHEGRLSSANAIACITCHAGPVSGVDGRRVSLGVNNVRGQLNALTTFNAAFSFRQFWDGRSVTLEDQALEPILSELEMANTEAAVLAFLRSDERYPARFDAVYPDGITIPNMVDAMAHFQRIHFTRTDSPFQRHLRGEEGPLSDQALRGWQRFEELGCVGCHNGINLGSNSYQKLGTALPYYNDHREAGPHDEGVKGRSGRERDRHVFKVPGLHTVATTAPYFHDGSVRTLEAAITAMGEHQLGRELNGREISDIAAFLRTLTAGFASVPVDISVPIDPTQAGQQGPETESSAASHHDAYRSSIEAITTAHTELLNEIQRIHSAEVAHYDFLQFQHIELIRHARALHHPPSDLGAQHRDRLVSGAGQLLGEINRLEWTIADFLRARAMVRVFSTHIDRPETGPLADPLGDVRARLAEQEARAREAMASLMDSEIIPLAARLARQFPDAAE